MCFHINITSCIFQHNGPVAAIKLQQYRGHSGGISIGYDDDYYFQAGTDPATIPNNTGIYITGCKFYNNTSDPPQTTLTSDLLQAYRFTGRGGSISILFNATFSSDIYVRDSVVERSFAGTFGGGIYLAFTGYAHHTAVFNKMEFIKCTCLSGPGGLFLVSLFTNNVHEVSDTLEVYNSRFIENYSKGGGAINYSVDRKTNLIVWKLKYRAIVKICYNMFFYNQLSMSPCS